MESIARFVVSTTDLIEAEGRALKRIVGRVLLAIAIGVVALVMTLTGVGFVIFGLFAYLARLIAVPGAALVFGVVALGGAVAAAMAAKKLFK